MTATRADTELRLACRRIKMVTPNAMKRGFAPSVLKECVIAAVVIHPKSHENSGDHKTVEDGGSDEIHGAQRKV